METDPQASTITKYSVNVLRLLKAAQMQHGLRHADYTQYRRNCTARLRRLYKSLKFTHGRGKYSRRDISDSTITDVRFLHIVLYMAERAWSHAMEKRQLPDGPNSAQCIYLIGRLRKAKKWATLFSELCSLVGDSRTSLEAKAYASYMEGMLLFEQGQSWGASLTNFKYSRTIYEELGKYGDAENQVLCRQRVEELEPNIRYCSHKIGESKVQASEHLQIGEMEGPALDLFKSKLDAVKAEAKHEQAASTTEFHWLGRRFPISNSKTRVLILKAQELEKDVEGSTAESLPDEKRLGIFNKILSVYHEARSRIRNDLSMAGSESMKDELIGLDKAVCAVLGQHTIKRNLFLVSIATSKLSRQSDARNRKTSKPEELVRLYDLLLQNVADLSDLLTSGRERNDEEVALAENCDIRSLVFRAERCYYLAKSYSKGGKRTEAYALFSRALSVADNALQRLNEATIINQLLMEELKTLHQNCRSNICIEHATWVVEEQNTQVTLSKKSSNTQATLSTKKVACAEQQQQHEKFLLEKLDSYGPIVGDNNNVRNSPHIEAFLPPFQAVPVNPIIREGDDLNAWNNLIVFPSLANRIEKKKKKGLTSSKFWLFVFLLIISSCIFCIFWKKDSH